MKNALARYLTVGMLVAPAMSNAVDLQKVYDVLQAPFVGSTKQDLLQIQGDRIVATYANNLGGYTPVEESAEPPPVTFENCRQLGIRQALLDIAASGAKFQSFSRSSSHRFGVVPGRSEAVELFVGVKVFDADTGSEQDRTYHYIADDPSGGVCRLTDTLPVIQGLIKKKVAEEKMIGILKALPPEELKTVILKEETADWNILADKSVKKVFKAECDQTTVNIAISASQSLFRDKFQAEPVILFDFEQSRAWGKSDFDTEDHEKGMKGWWIVRMVSADGAHSMTTKMDFDMTFDSEKESCGGDFSSPPQVLN